MEKFSIISLGAHRVAAAFSGVVGDNIITIFDCETRQEVGLAIGHKNRVTGLVSLNPTYFVSSGADRTVRVWDAFSFSQSACFELDDPVFSLAKISSRMLVAGDSRGRLHWLEIEL